MTPGREADIMRKLIAAAVVAFAATGAPAAPASPASVESLFVLMRMQSTMDGMFATIEPIMRQAMAQATQGRPTTPAEQRSLDALPPRFAAVMREEFAWERVRPLYVQLYCETFDQTEVDGLLAFYGSPVGQALVDKTPIVTQKSIAISQSMMATMLPKMKEAIRQATEDAKAGK